MGGACLERNLVIQILARCKIKAIITGTKNITGAKNINQIAVNLFTNVLAMGIGMLISMWLTPYLINELGLIAYGYTSVINNLFDFLKFITYTLTSMVGRFLIVSIERDGPQEASKYMSSALFANLFFGIVFLPIIILLGLGLDGLLKIQSNFIADVKISFIISGITFLFGLNTYIFATGAYCKNRLHIRNGVNIFSTVIRAAFLLLIFSFFSARIWIVALATALTGLISLIFWIFNFRALLPDVRFNIQHFNFHSSIELLSSGFLISIRMLGNSFLTQIDLIVGNRYLPAEVVGMYAAILLLPNSIRNIGLALSSAFTPTTISLYSSGNMDDLRKFSNRVVKFCGLMVGWPVAILSGLAIPILKTWLGKDYSPYETTIIIMLLPLTAHLAVNQLFNVQQAMNKVKIPALASILFGVINLFLAIFFTASLKMGVFGIVLSSVIMSTIRTVIFVPIYTAVITNQPKYAYYRGMILPFFITLATCTAGILIQKYISINSLFSIIYAAFGLSILYITISMGVLSNEERKIIIQKGISILKHQVE